MRIRISILFLLLCLSTSLVAQTTEREKPKEWENLVEGGPFIDRFLPMPIQGNLTEDTWGADHVIPRDIDNGIEDSKWSYWGGNIKNDNKGNYHLFIARWAENSSKGHGEWPNSIVVRAVADHPIGPYIVEEIIGKGHNPEVFQLKDGRYLVYVIDVYYISDNIDGPWSKGEFEFDPRGREIIEGLSNLTFAQREDGSYLMLCRGGGVWISKTGLSPYKQISNRSIYPRVAGRFEDPVIWRDQVQYHMIVNDWLGRIAYYLRSKNGITWKADPGEAYKPGIAAYEDGTLEDWFKYERLKILQDDFGRAIQANFAVIDVKKANDRGDDNHSSKNISIPLVVGRQIEVLNTKKIDKSTNEIRLKLKAENGFKPHKDVEINSLRFGASEEVNFGRGSKVKKVIKEGSDLIITFEGKGNGITKDNFAGKLIGKTNGGKLLFGYSRLPGVAYLEPILSARKPIIKEGNNEYLIEIEVENFGQVKSRPSQVILKFLNDENEYKELGIGKVPALAPYEHQNVTISIKKENLENKQKVKVVFEN